MPEGSTLAQVSAIAVAEIQRRIGATSTPRSPAQIAISRMLRARKTEGGLALTPLGSHITAIVEEKVPGSFLAAVASGTAELLRTYAKNDWSTPDLYSLLSSLWRIEQILRRMRLFAWPIDRARASVGRATSVLQLKRLAMDYSEVAIHYDLPRELFEAFLSNDLAYSAAEIRHQPEAHEAAYQLSYDRAARRLLGTKTNGVILDLGCGWGSFDKFILEQTSHAVHAITISRAQAEYVQRSLMKYVPDRLTVVVGDFREASNLPQHTDAIVMIETIEHVAVLDRLRLFKLLARRYQEATLLLQFTAAPDWAGIQKPRKATAANSVIFPGPAKLSSAREIIGQARRVGYEVVRAEDLTAEYSAATLVWRSRFLSNYEQLSARLPTELLRAWDFYLTGLTTGLGQRAVLNYQLTLVQKGKSVLEE